MTKEEEYLMQRGISGFSKRDFSHVQNIDLSEWLSEYAEQEANEFANWIVVNATEYEDGWKYNDERDLLTTSQLYQIFKSQQNAK